MSKKTKNIYKEIDELQIVQEKLLLLCEKLKNRSIGSDGSDESFELISKELDDLQFGMNQNLKTLKFWIDSLYAYNGKSTSNAKQASSRENGKKGGRPKKEISVMKKRLSELNELIPEIEHKIRISIDLDEENKLQNQLMELTSEKDVLLQKLAAGTELAQ